MESKDRRGRGDEGVSAQDRMFVESWKRVRPELSRRARRLADGHVDRAEDLLSATAMKAMLFMRRSPELMTDPDGFLFVVLRHVFLDNIRRQQRERGVFDDNVEADDDRMASNTAVLSQSQRIELEEQLESVVRAVRKLSRDQKQLFGMRFVQELPYPTIARRLNINQALARKRVQLLRARLRRSSDDAGPLP
ncbi:RNA polymerase sigma factor [Marilutibacter aestuarii]|uniref:Sigma-70 family RNA polymerase sigma factor n=1 Tax=Marilutibacter aestuarii TaxID=1706195 RepID=A0A508A290_9GAMM|nr:sigma-70 family RNA polymerase sigma factor [Lysobacter aestuarii]TQD39942.1 sigma-70 family RNA polymerase sigma factor [Lysobacter aestuarii]